MRLTADPLACAPPPLALCTRLQLRKRTVVCRPSDKPSSLPVCSFFLFFPGFLLSPPLPPSLSLSLNHLLVLSVEIFPSPVTATDGNGHWTSAGLCSTLVLFVLCWQKPPHKWMTLVSSPSPDSKSPDYGQTTPSSCPLCQHEQLILGVIILAVTLIDTMEVIKAAPPLLDLSLHSNPRQRL